MEIRREAYLNQLIERRDNGMIKIITGIRRCGKSYLLFTIFKRYLLESGVPEDHIIEIALDGIENEELRDPKVCFRYITDAMRGDGPYYLLLDEVQFMPRFEEVLNSLLRMSNIDVYVTGSVCVRFGRCFCSRSGRSSSSFICCSRRIFSCCTSRSNSLFFHSHRAASGAF